LPVVSVNDFRMGYFAICREFSQSNCDMPQYMMLRLFIFV